MSSVYSQPRNPSFILSKYFSPKKNFKLANKKYVTNKKIDFKITKRIHFLWTVKNKKSHLFCYFLVETVYSQLMVIVWTVSVVLNTTAIDLINYLNYNSNFPSIQKAVIKDSTPSQSNCNYVHSSTSNVHVIKAVLFSFILQFQINLLTIKENHQNTQ